MDAVVQVGSSTINSGRFCTFSIILDPSELATTGRERCKLSFSICILRIDLLLPSSLEDEANLKSNRLEWRKRIPKQHQLVNFRYARYHSHKSNESNYNSILLLNVISDCHLSRYTTVSVKNEGSVKQSIDILERKNCFYCIWFPRAQVKLFV